VLKSEILFVGGIDPFTRVARLTEGDIDRIVGVARELMSVSVRRGSRQTTRSLNPQAKLWVYGRRGLPCRKCGTLIQSKQTGEDARFTYWCPSCQPVSR